MTETCTNTSNTCPSDSFCPATDSTAVSCKPCDSSIPQGQGCNCSANTPIENCTACDAGKCKTCASGFVVSRDGASCTACSANCTICTDASNCQKCLPEFYLNFLAGKCFPCESPQMLQNGVCVRPCMVNNDCDSNSFCNLASSICQVCDEGCTSCVSEGICGSCSNGFPNINGECGKACNPKATSGNYCDNGVVKPCAVGIIQQCVCGSALHCETCDAGNACATCLPGFKLDSGVCTFCSEGYTQFANLCLKGQFAAGQCTQRTDKCEADTFCAAKDSQPTLCKKCDESIIKGQGCDCVANIKSVNCMKCASGVCVQCIKGFGVNETTNACEACGSNCSECSSPAKCTKCAEGFKQVDGICIAACDAKKPCSKATEFCDMTSLTCQACGAECSKCKTKEVCGGCTDATKKLNINGVCEANCTPPPADGQYCKAGTATTCAAGLTSECVCKAAKNCASCTTDFTMCLTCLPGFKLVAGACEQCADGYEKYETMCLGAEKKIDAVSKLSGGAIAGIVIACLVVAGGVGGGLAYYFIRKGKSGAAHTVQKAGQQ